MPYHDFRAIYLPYCLEQNKEGLWLVLNRNYKPLGFSSTERVNYEDYPIASKFQRLGPATLRKLSCTGDYSENRIFLYNDSCNPIRSDEHMNKYMEKLKILAQLKIA